MPNMTPKKTPMPEQAPDVRNKNFEEVALGYTDEMAMEEAQRCLNCKHKPCVNGCPVGVPIPEFISHVPKGQMEAGYCAGMTYPRIMTRIILPQAARTAFPPLSNSLIGLVKDTSLASNITIMEMFMSAQRIAARTYDSFALYCEVALIYLLFCTVLTKVQRICEKKLELK